MPQLRQPTLSPNDMFQILKTHPRRWIVPAVALMLAALAYSLIRPATWQASQALTVRDEAASGERLGKFPVVEEMKTVQETILELAKSHGVLAATLKQVGPPGERSKTAGCRTPAGWPTDQDVAALQAAVALSPPHGAEFGKTEVFYLQVQSHDRRRAVAVASALSDKLKQRFEDLRDSKAQSMIDELTKTVTLAQNDLETSTHRLARIDASVGADLGELRTLADDAAGDSPLRRSVTEMETELRVAQAANQANEELLRFLQAATNDPNFLLAAPSRLLESQPSLRKLKDSLLDAQLHTAQLLGSMGEKNPHVLTARAAEVEIASSIHNEVAAAIGGVKLELHLSTDRSATLDTQLAAAKLRLSRLAAIRADYANRVAEVHRRTDTLKAAENQLAEARASQASAHSASLISRIDTPQTGAYPIGPSRSTIVLSGLVGGLFLGLCIVFLTVQTSQPEAAEVEPAVHDWTGQLPPATNGRSPTPAAATLPGDWPRNTHTANPFGNLSFKEALAKIDAGKRRY